MTERLPSPATPDRPSSTVHLLTTTTTTTRRRPALDLLGGAPSATALVTSAASVDVAELADRIDDRRAELGTGRRLVLASVGNTVDSIVTYLAALAAGHPVLLLPGEGDADADPGLRSRRERLIERYDPDVVVHGGRADAAGPAIEQRHAQPRHRFHPDLALLATTSGSTGSPKLVRLSRDNVLANAHSIAEYLRIAPDDRAATTLPMHYCYGLSVINSHLVAGASLLLTGRSVVEPGFWSDFEARDATSFAGVPYTFELLDASGFADRVPESLHTVTQAGGRLAPERVRAWARLGRDEGFDFVVMYGQTEATARMAYLPPDLAETAAGAIGQPIPGGAFRIDGARGCGEVGELVYSGPNVMLGYAEHPADLALGRAVHELRTGDLARHRPDGLVEIVGRASRFVKVFGLRIDLDHVERLLEDAGIPARAVAHDERMSIFVLADRVRERASQVVADAAGLPMHAFDVHAVAEFPRTASGKPDHAALREYAALLRGADAAARMSPAATPASELRDLYAELLGRPDATEVDSFTSLDGDSLNYVELALQLEARIGALPADWPSRPIRDLGGKLEHAPSSPVGTGEPARAVSEPGAVGAGPTGRRDRQRPRRIARLETSVVLRAVAILVIVATHADVVQLKGGAHLLLAVAGFNLARFRLSGGTGHPAGAQSRGSRIASSRRVRGLLRSALAIAVPAVLWIGGVALIARTYDPATVLLSNWLVPGATAWSGQWQFWFLEALVWTIIGLAVLFAVPGIDALERRHPYAVALAVLGAALAWRYAVSEGVTASSPLRYSLPAIVWLIVLGWLVARSTTRSRRVAATAIVLATVPGFFGDPVRESIVIAGLGLLIWVTSLPVPTFLAGAIGTAASASMFVYLTHWQVYPPIEEVSPPLAVVASFAVGVAAWWAWGRASGRLSARRRRGSRSAA